MTGPSRTSSGFTLLEVLVVLALMGVVLAFAAASLRGPEPGDQVHEEATRMQALMQLASEEAIIQARIHGVRLLPNGYAFAAFGAQGWTTVERKPLQPRTLPSHMRFVDTPAQSDEARGPQVLLFADGTVTPFEVGLESSASEETARVIGTVTGEIRVPEQN